MSTYGGFPEAWFDAHQALTGFLAELLPQRLQDEVAARAIGRWLTTAADGAPTPYGAYRYLYGLAETTLSHRIGSSMSVTAEELWARIPVDTPRRAYELGRFYCEIHKAAVLSGWDRATNNTLGKQVGMYVPTSPSTAVVIDDGVWRVPTVYLLRCAFDLLRKHECTGCDLCKKVADMWDEDDRRNEAWHTATRLYREGL